MKTILLLITVLFPLSESSGRWGATGHRVVGDIAEQHLSEQARQEVGRILGDESLAIASTWMDEIRSDPDYDHTHDWHWVTIPDRMSYGDTEKNADGDIIKAITDIITALENGNLGRAEEAEQLKILIHLIGDIHQPLHVGTGEDRGGNMVRVEWFGNASNLHSVWDSGVIDHTKLSYTELSDSINHPTEEQVDEWQQSGVLDWAYESIKLRNRVYDMPEDLDLGYEYVYKHYEIVERRLLQAGVRLAGVLNDIYGD